jgi:proline-specific peptidase
MQHTDQGYIPVPGGWVWYRRIGPRNTIPVLVLHGGPGAGYGYLEALEALADEREVIFYDQLGCGQSETPTHPALWRIERFVAELYSVRRALRLEHVHLYGHSWGGWLAIEYMLTHPPGVVSLTLASTSASLPEHRRELERLKDALPADIAEVLRRHEALGDFNHPDYKAALLSFYQRHFCRLEVWPPALEASITGPGENPVYTEMQGVNEIVINGNLKDWDRSDRLGEITVPTLITVGRYDEITPTCATTLQRGMPNAELHIFEQSAHMPHLEEPERYFQTLRSAFRRAEAQPIDRDLAHSTRE